MLPQKSYIADGTLKEAVTYLRPPETRWTTVTWRVLEQVELGHLVDRLHEPHHRWGHLLSGGEQQKLAFARAMLYRPDIPVHGRGHQRARRSV